MIHSNYKSWLIGLQLEILIKDKASLESQVLELLTKNQQLQLENSLLKEQLTEARKPTLEDI